MACVRKRRGKWVTDFYDQFGKRHWETIGTSKKEAEERLAKRLLEVKSGSFSQEGEQTTFREIADAWYKNHAKVNTRLSTYEGYHSHIYKHLIPFFGDIKLNRITPSLIDKFKAEKLEEGLHRETINKILTRLGGVLKYAVRHRIISHNPTVDVDKLSTSQSEKEEDQPEETNILTPEEVNLLLEHTTYRPLIFTAVLTGARQGELLALQWGDIDWNARQIHIRRSIYRGRLFEPKTKRSKRKIDMTPTLVSELKRWKLACPNSGDNLLFPNEVGKPIDPSNLRKRIFEPALRRAGLRKVRFHDLRHTYASLLIHQGEHPKYIQTQLGHSSINVTMDTYGHLMEGVNVQATKRLDATLFGKNGSKMVATK